MHFIFNFLCVEKFNRDLYGLKYRPKSAKVLCIVDFESQISFDVKYGPLLFFMGQVAV